MVGEEAERGSMIGIAKSDQYQYHYQCVNQCISEVSSKELGATRKIALLDETFIHDITRRGIVRLQTPTIHQVTYHILN